MSEHDSHDDPVLGALYRRAAQEEPPAHLDERVMTAARRHVARRSHRWWLPLSSAAVVVLAISLLLRQQQAPDELQQQMAHLEASRVAPESQVALAPAPSEPLVAPAAAPTPLPPAPKASRRRAMNSEQQAKSSPAEAAQREIQFADPLAAEAAPGVEPPAAAVKEGATAQLPSTAALAETPPDVAGAATRQVEATAGSAEPRAMAKAEQKRNEAAEAPDAWLKRIETLRVKGELAMAKRELVAFRKVYPRWPLPKELQALLPEPVK